MSDQRYAVIIPHYNDPTRLTRCLNALMPQIGPEGEVVVVDNGSTVDISEVKNAFPAVRFEQQLESGAGPARNMGVAKTDAPWLMFIDADCVPADDWIAVGREIGREGTIIGGRVDVFHETEPPKSGAEAFEEVFAFKMRAYLERDAFLGAGNLVLPRAVFEGTGGFLPAVSEDKEWSQRAASKGFTLAFDDRFAAGHPSRQDWAALRRKWARLTVEAFLLRREAGKGRAGWALRALAMPASAVAHAPRVLRCESLTAQEKGRALVTLLRIRCARMIWMLGQAITGKAEI